MGVGEEIILPRTYLGFFIFNCNQNNADLIYCFPSTFHVTPARTKAFVIPWDEIFYSLMLSVHLLCYPSSCHKCLRRGITFKFVAATIQSVFVSQRFVWLYWANTMCNCFIRSLYKDIVVSGDIMWILKKLENAVCFLLGDSLASEFYKPTFRNTLSVPSS
jgi:hypothetical protein